MDDKVVDLLRRRTEIVAGGGEAKVEGQHRKGKKTARERIDALLDPGSFVEIDAFVEHRCREFGMEHLRAPGEGVVTGHGTVKGRLIFVYSQDFTVIGGTLGEMHAAKICKVMDMAMKVGAPVVGFDDSGGARIQEGVDALSGYGKIFYRNTLASGVVPQISVVMGPCAGGAVYSPALTDFIFMTDKTSHMFITGPQVIKAVSGADVDPEELGGAKTHNQVSGVAHFVHASEEETIAAVRKLLGFLPPNHREHPPIAETSDDPRREVPELHDLVPANSQKSYDIRKVILPIVDEGEFFEIQSHYAINIVVGLARLRGQPVGIVANQTKHLAGCLDINASDKAARFIRFCDGFNIPLITLVDVPGFLPGTAQEFGGIIRHGAKMLFAYSEATVPKITLILRKAYGGAYQAMCSKDLGADQVIAWPTAEIAVMGPHGAADIIFRKEIDAAPDPDAMRRQKIEEYRQLFANPYVAAARGFIDDVIEPRFTRSRMIDALAMLTGKREERPAKKHGNIPL
jgi:acetyl-CoA carboxylase carboxyltransferase component